MEEELLTCALLCCPPEDILETLSLFKDGGAEQQFFSASFVKPTAELILDPMYTLIDEYHLSNTQ